MTSEELKWFWDGLDKYLAEHDLKQTKQRHVILKKIVELGSHIDADQLHEALREDGHSTGIATVYRTLNLLVSARLVDQLSFIDGRSVYELRHPGKHHDHIVCTDCGKIFEFEDDTIEERQKQVLADQGFKLEDHRLNLWGSCQKPECENRTT